MLELLVWHTIKALVVGSFDQRGVQLVTQLLLPLSTPLHGVTPSPIALPHMSVVQH